MADCEYQIGGKGKFYSESEFKKLLSEGYLDKVMMEESLTIKGIKPNEAIASSFQLPSAIQPTVPVTEVKIESINSVLNPKHKGFGERMEGSKDKVKQTFEEDNNVDYVFRNSSKEEVDNLLSGEGKTGDFWRSEPNEYSNYGDYIIVKKTPDLKEYGREYSKGNKIENDGFNYVGEKVSKENVDFIYNKKTGEIVYNNNPELVESIKAVPTEAVAKTEEVVTPTGGKNNYKIAQDVTAEVSKENPDASVLLTPKGEDLSLTAVYVGKENRGKGIGTKVLESVKKQADKLGKKIVLDATTELDEETDLGRLESFYQNNGFTKVGENKFEYNPTTETKTEEVVTPVNERRKVLSEELDNADINSLRTSLRKKDPNGYTLQILDELQESKKNENLVLDDNVAYLLDNGITLSNVKNMLIEDGLFETSKEVDNYFSQIGGQKSSGIFKRLSGLKSEKTTQPVSETVTKTEEKVTEPAAEVERLRAEEQKELREAIPNIEFLQERNMDRGYMTAEDVANYERIYNKYDKLITPLLKQPTTEATTQAATETKKGKIESATKNFADFLREAKMSGGNTMSSLIPPPLWNKAIDIVADSVQAGGVALGKFTDFLDSSIETIKKSDFFKNLSTNDKRNFSRNIRKELAKYAAEQFDLNFSQADMRDAEFNDLNDQLEAAKTTKPTPKQLEALKRRAKKFVERNLPKDVYNKTEVIKEINNNFDKTKTVNGIQKALDRENKRIQNKEFKIETAEAKQAEKDRKAAVKRIKEKTNPKGNYMTAKVNQTKKARVSIDAQRKINELRNQGFLEDSYLDSLNKEETDELEAFIDEILGIGKAERKQELKEKRVEKKSSEAVILQALDKQDQTLNSKDAIEKMFDDNRGAVVIVDGRTMNEKDFKEYANENTKADFSNTPVYKSRVNEVNKMKQKYASNTKSVKNILKGIRYGTMGAIRNIETYLPDLVKGSKEMREWFTEAVNDITYASLAKLESQYYKKRELNEATNKIFGKTKIAGVKTPVWAADSVLGGNSGLQLDKNGRNPVDLTNGEVVDLYNIVRDKYNNKDIDADKVEKNRERVRKANQIDPKEIMDYINANPKLKEFADLLADTYNKQYRKEYAPLWASIYGSELPEDTYYYPEPAAEFNATDAINLEDTTKGMSAFVPSLRLRTDNYTGAFHVVDAREKINTYIDSMSHAKEFIPIIENVRPLFSDINRPRVLAKLKDLEKYNDLKKTMEDILSNKTAFESQGGYDRAANAAAVGALWFRLKSIPQQFSAFINYYPSSVSEGVGAFDVLASVTPQDKNQLKFFKDFYFDNPYLYERLSGGNVSIDTQAVQSSIDKIANKYARGTIDAITFMGMLGIKGGDALAIASPPGGQAFAMAHFKKRMKENGGNYDEARKYAIQQWFKQTERTQQPSKDPTTISTVSKNPVFRMIQPFISAQLAATRKAVIAVKNMKDWKNLNEKEKRQAKVDLLYYSTVGNLPFILGSGAISTLTASIMDYINADDEEDKKIAVNEFKILAFNTILDRIQSDAQSFYVLGKVGSDILNDLRGRSWFKNNPTFEKLKDLSTAISSLSTSFSDWDELSKVQQEDFFKRYSFSKYEAVKFNKLNEEEKMQYLEDHPKMKQALSYDKIEEFKKMYSELPFYEKVGAEGADAFERTFNLKNPNKLLDALDAYFDGNTNLRDVIMAISPDNEDADYDGSFEMDVKNKENILQQKVFGKSAAEMLIKDRPVLLNGDLPKVGGAIGGPEGGQEGGPVGGPR